MFRFPNVSIRPISKSLNKEKKNPGKKVEKIRVYTVREEGKGRKKKKVKK